MTTRLPKAALSQYLRNRCDRMLACIISESSSSATTLLSLPARPGLAGFKARGIEFEAEFIGVLNDTFPDEYVDLRKTAGGNRQADLVFKERLEKLADAGGPLPCFFKEPTLLEERYRDDLLLALAVDPVAYPAMTDLRPDLVIALDSAFADPAQTANEILPDGSVRAVRDGDKRIALRVVDLKFAEQLNVAYAGEVCLYAMVLAAWLAHPQIGLATRFYVTATPGILVRRTERVTHIPAATAPMQRRLEWFEKQIDQADADLYAPPVVRFFQDDLKRVLSKLPDWHSLEWHVTPSCSFCDYLGYPGWSKNGIAAVQLTWEKKKRAAPAPVLEDYCFEDARKNNRLNHLPNTTRGMLRTLQNGQVQGLADLRTRPGNDAVFDKHNGLRLESLRLPRKAGAVVDSASSNHPNSMSGSIARYADLLVTVVCFFDAATGRLTSLGMGVDYKSPTEWGNGRDKDGKPIRVPTTPRIDKKQQMMWVVEEDSDACEGKHLLDCLRFLSQFIEYVLSSSAAPDEVPEKEKWAAFCKDKATIQVIFWDARQDEAFREAIGRHLHEIINSAGVTNALLWLFPPREIEQSDSVATTPAACHLHDVVVRLVALPTIINDDMISVANKVADFSDGVSPYMWDRVAGVIPKERSLEISQAMPPKKPPMSISQCVDQYKVVLRTLLHALRQIVFTVQRDYKGQLMGDAPRIRDLSPTRFQKVAADTMLWLTHQRVNDGVSALGRKQAFAGDPHELETRYQALRVHGLVGGTDRLAVLKGWEEQGIVKAAAVGDQHFLFRVRGTSRHVKFRNDTGWLVLLPEEPQGAGLMSVRGLCSARGIDPPDSGEHQRWKSDDNFKRLANIFGADLVYFDRENLLALIAFNFPPNFEKVRILARTGAIDFGTPMVLMERLPYSDFDKIKDVAEQIGNPAIAAAAAETRTALVEVSRKPGRDPLTPAAMVLWRAGELAEAQTDTELENFDAVLDNVILAGIPAEANISINSSQREAIKRVIARQLLLVWGGPGTGKTQTLAVTIILELLLRFHAEGGPPQRTYVTGPTYRAVVEVASRLARILPHLPEKVMGALGGQMVVSFVASDGNKQVWDPLLADGRYSGFTTELYVGRELRRNGAEVNGENLATLRERLLRDDNRVELVFSVKQQSYNIGTGGIKNGDERPNAVGGLFDRIFLDESSQVSVADSLPTLGLLADHGRLALFGDPLQMPPIQEIESPVGAEFMVGSLHSYLKTRFPKVSEEERFLKTNYRSCEPIVRYARMIGYKEEFEAEYPNRAFTYTPLRSAPTPWPQDFPWWSIYDRILDPARPCVAVTYDDGSAGQANEFEATMVAGVVLAYRASVKGQAGAAFKETDFWANAVGVVTPHRAQRSALVELLRKALAPEAVSANLIDDAVDTVERFQGGERDLILVSFGIGDPDLVRREERFLFQRQRINVAISRARAKAVLFLSRDLLYHLPDDKDTVLDSRAIKGFAFQLANERDGRVALEFREEHREVEVRYARYPDPAPS